MVVRLSALRTCRLYPVWYISSVVAQHLNHCATAVWYISSVVAQHLNHYRGPPQFYCTLLYTQLYAHIQNC